MGLLIFTKLIYLYEWIRVIVLQTNVTIPWIRFVESREKIIAIEHLSMSSKKCFGKFFLEILECTVRVSCGDIAYFGVEVSNLV